MPAGPHRRMDFISTGYFTELKGTSMDINSKDIDIGLLRRRKKRRRQLVKFFAVMLLAGVVITLYAKRDSWIPKLEGIGGKFQSVKSNQGELAEGNFPLSISGGIDYQTAELNGHLAIMSDAYLYIYTDNGDLYEERQHAYSNAMLQTAGKKALVYESGGNRFRVENRSSVLYSKKLEDNIIFARISEDGRAAVITDSDTYLCRIIVYDESGKEIYSRDCVERVIDFAFSEDSKGCVLATVDAVEGNICSKIVSVSFDSKKDNWSSDQIDTMCLRLYQTDDDIFVLGDTKCAYYDNKGKLKTEYAYPAKLADWDYSGGKTAMLFENETKRHSYVTTIDSEKKEPNVMEFNDNSAKCIRIIDEHICVLGKDGIMQYNFSGGGEKKISSEGSYEKMISIDDYIFLLGYDRIDRIDYKG